MWLDRPVLVTVKLISQITGLPMQGPDPSQYFCSKYNDNRLAAKLRNKYGFDHDKWEYVVDTITDKVVHVVTNILAIKVVSRIDQPNVLRDSSHVPSCVPKAYR